MQPWPCQHPPGVPPQPPRLAELATWPGTRRGGDTRVPQVTRGTRSLAESSFPEDTVADHVGGTRGRRYYQHLSDDEDLVASGGEVAPGGRGSPGMGVTVSAALSPLQMATGHPVVRWHQMPSWVGVTWVPLLLCPLQMAAGCGGIWH